MRNLGRCPCGGRYEHRLVEVRIADNRPEPVVLGDVPQGACPTCGSRVYPVTVLGRLELLMRGREETIRAH